jgi:hypothetical protein
MAAFQPNPLFGGNPFLVESTPSFLPAEVTSLFSDLMKAGGAKPRPAPLSSQARPAPAKKSGKSPDSPKAASPSAPEAPLSPTPALQRPVMTQRKHAKVPARLASRDGTNDWDQEKLESLGSSSSSAAPKASPPPTVPAVPVAAAPMPPPPIAPPTTTPAPATSGPLHKRSAIQLATNPRGEGVKWETKELALDGEVLTLCSPATAPGAKEGKDAKTAELSVPLSDVRVTEILETGTDLTKSTSLAFVVEAGKRILRLRAPSRPETVEWLELLCKVCKSEPLRLQLVGADESPSPRARNRSTSGQRSQKKDTPASAPAPANLKATLTEPVEELDLSDSGRDMDSMVGGHRRADLYRTHMRRPRVSLQRLELLLSWINSLRVWPTPVEAQTMAKDMANGLLLCAIMEKLVPGTKYVGIHRKPLSRQAAIKNIEEALAVVWRSARVNNRMVPPAGDIYQGKPSQVANLVTEIFEVYAMKPTRKQSQVMLRWYASVLQQYDRAQGLSDTAEGAALWEHFQNGVSLWCVMFHFCGTNLVGSQENARAVDPKRIFSRPRDLAEYRSNIQECFLIMKAVGIPIIYTVDAWISYPDDVSEAPS